MSMTVEQLHREALALRPEEQEELALLLLRDTAPDPEIEKAWIKECQRRIERQRANPVPLKDAFEVIDEIFERVRSKA